MEKSSEILKNTAVTLEKYKKNKTLVSPEDLSGKYKVLFEKLKQKLADELSEYLKAYSLERLVLIQDDYIKEFAETVNRIFQGGIGKRVSRAAFKEFDLEQIKQIAEELRSRIYEEAYVPYFQKHICLYTSDECFSDENPQPPRIYNSLVDKFWNEEIGEWTTNDADKKPALLIFIQGEKN